MEEFTFRRVLDCMHHRGIKLSKKVIFTQYLNYLSSNYENVVSNIMQTLRKNFELYTLDELFSNLSDEPNRLQSKDKNAKTVLVAEFNKKPHKSRTKKPYKITKGLHFRHCNRTNNKTTDCFDFFPEKGPYIRKKVL